MEMELKITTDVIQAKTRKLKATWTVEHYQDIKSYTCPIAAAELAKIISEDLGIPVPKTIQIKPKKYRSLDDDWLTE